MTVEPDWHSWDGVSAIRSGCDRQAESEGLTGIELIFRSIELFNEALNERPTYRERQSAWMASQGSKVDPFKEALRLIAGGHNDPRSLAMEVLGIDSGD